MDPVTFLAELPHTWQVDVVRPKTGVSLVDPQKAAAWALAEPLEMPPLSEMVGPGDQVCLILSGPSPVGLAPNLINPALRELERAGVYPPDITLLHSPGTRSIDASLPEARLLGPDTPGGYRIIEHDVNDVVPLSEVMGIPLTVNLRALESDLLMAIGIVTPHPYAGYSGGADSVALGCSGESTIQALHSPPFVNNPLVSLGQVADNPFQHALRLAAQRAGLRFVLNAALDSGDRIMDVRAGEPAAVHDALVAVARELYQATLKDEYDLVIAHAHPPWTANLYGIGQIISRLGFSVRPPLRSGGTMIVTSPPDQPTTPGPTLEAERFFATLSAARNLEALLDDLRENCCQPGETLAYRLAHLLQQHEIVIVGSDFPELIQACHMQAVPDLATAVEHVYRQFGNQANVLVVPQAAHTVLTFQSEWQLHPLDC